MDAPDVEPIDDDEFERELRRSDLRPDDGRWGWSPGRILALVLVLGMLAFWTWAFLWSPRGHPDELDDTAFPAFAEARCLTALGAIDEVPGAIEATGPEDRAEQLVVTNGILEELVADLRGAAPDVDTRDGELVSQWLDDWEIYLGDRTRHLVRLQAGADPQFLVSAPDGEHVTAPLDLFATINRMPSCVVPGDL